MIVMRSMGDDWQVCPGDRFTMPYEDFWGWEPEFKAEWVDGEAIVYPPQWTRENQVMVFLGCVLGAYVRAFDLGEAFISGLGMDIPARPSVRLPDVLVVLKEHADRLTREGLMGSADLLFELVSEDSLTLDRVEKFKEYEQAGVTECVFVDTRPDHEDCDYFRLSGEGRYHPVAPDDQGRYHSAVLTGFWIDPAWFRQDPLPEAMDVVLEIGGDAYRNYLLALIDNRKSRLGGPRQEASP
jgi:Uma2 family endonuclease